MSEKYILSASQIIENDYKLAVHSLIEKAKQQQCKLLGISTSMQIKNEKEINIRSIAMLLHKLDINLTVVNMDEYCNLDELCKNSEFNYIPFADKPTDLQQLKSKYDLTLVNLAPLKLFADAMITAQKCDALVLMEKYSSTRHYQFDSLLSDINVNNINLLGVIANK